jgi:hypothetical protein
MIFEFGEAHLDRSGQLGSPKDAGNLMPEIVFDNNCLVVANPGSGSCSPHHEEPVQFTVLVEARHTPTQRTNESDSPGNQMISV